MRAVEDIKLPNLFIVGVPRSGTTSLYEYLKRHPEVFMSPCKEPHYFARKDIYEFLDEISPPKIISDFKEYISLFEGGKGKKIRGEASAIYFFSKSATREIYELIPDAKIIISLRNPIERALSHFKLDILHGIIIARSFCEAIRKRSLYLWMGLYYEHVKRYLETFPKQNVKIIIYDDLKNDTSSVMKDICRFLEIDENY
ncbi:MAG: sulfotransferase family protein, partial [Candidatus Calescibacterium sp.]